jgi:MoxR-like ATPase
MARSLRELNEYIRQEAAFIRPLLAETRRIIVGQDYLINRMLVALLSDGHILIEGVPGLAKTLAVRTLSATISANFQRVQFTPDLLPADLVGTQIYNPGTGEFTPRLGPVFTNILLADEINRAPAKVQSALLESMEERQITIGEQTFKLDKPYMVLATQNPVEQEGTYPLPEAQLDRFMLKAVVGYPTRKQEREILRRMSGTKPDDPEAVVSTGAILKARQVVTDVYVDERIEDYVLDIVFATRQPAEFDLQGLSTLLDFGASPRATLALIKAARAGAFLAGRGYVTPDDVKAIAPDVLRHRLIVSFEAQAEAVSADDIIKRILNRIEVP